MQARIALAAAAVVLFIALPCAAQPLGGDPKTLFPLGSVWRDISPDRYPYPVPAATGKDVGVYRFEHLGREVLLDHYLGRRGPYHAFGPDTYGAPEVWFEPRANRWIVTDPSGLRYTYGGDASTRAGIDTSSAAGTWAWGLTSVEDGEGNSISLGAPEEREAQRRVRGAP